VSAGLSLLLGVLLIADPEAAERIEVAERIVELEDEGMADRVRENAKEAERLRISAARGDFDRNEGVALFEGAATVDYSADYHMRSDRLFAFFRGSNQLDRIVAAGHVSVRSGKRAGTCASAVFRRAAGEIEMFGSDTELAHLSENGVDDLAGRRIKFWLDAEQVEIGDSEITFAKGAKKVRAATAKGQHE